ncbi:MAG: class I SAM-dependent methyltransferase [Coleofasciculus sp. G3-WIS-01]|uniref:class I SAM-dependent methyltransferase n=1 Tax=Coleofasciculus sp. G3-WIS-01 TaxID=3069528 RepID=UPI0032F57E58
MINQNCGSADPICPISGAELKPWLLVPGDWMRSSVNASYQLYWCDESKLGRLYPTPEAGMIASFYDIDDYYTHTITRQSPTISSNISFLEQLNSFLDKLRVHLAWRLDHGIEITTDWFKNHFDPTSKSICEIGCGNGNLLAKLQADGHTVVGVEPDPVARSIAIQKRGLNVFDGTAESLPPEIQSRRYDIVVMTHVLEHTIDPVLALHNAMLLLAPNGKLVIETPNNEALGLKWAGITWFSLRVPRHLNFFTKDSLIGICEKVGLKVVKTEFRGYSRQFVKNYIKIEQKIWDVFYSIDCKNKRLPNKNSRLKTWLLLLATFFVDDAQKYDCVRVIAKQ